MARDPRRGQYKKYGSPYSRLCKEVIEGGQGSQERKYKYVARDPTQGLCDAARDPRQGLCDAARDPSQGLWDAARDHSQGLCDAARDPR